MFVLRADICAHVDDVFVPVFHLMPESCRHMPASTELVAVMNGPFARNDHISPCYKATLPPGSLSEDQRAVPLQLALFRTKGSQPHRTTAVPCRCWPYFTAVRYGKVQYGTAYGTGRDPVYQYGTASIILVFYSEHGETRIRYALLGH